MLILKLFEDRKICMPLYIVLKKFKESSKILSILYFLTMHAMKVCQIGKIYFNNMILMFTYLIIQLLLLRLDENFGSNSILFIFKHNRPLYLRCYLATWTFN